MSNLQGSCSSYMCRRENRLGGDIAPPALRSTKLASVMVPTRLAACADIEPMVLTVLRMDSWTWSCATCQRAGSQAHVS
jgi:hypothetical protein